MSANTVSCQTTINGEAVEVTVPPRLLLVDLLRDRLGLTGTHVGCTFEAVCGACTVQLDGVAVKSCSVLAAQVANRNVTTVEGLGSRNNPHPLQAAFQKTHALQCGYCTPGIIMNMTDFLRENPDPTEEEIRFALAGNICRCTGYSHIVEAVQIAAAEMRSQSAEAAE
ncbi:MULTISPECIES: (2Fe-2S)-binding protein [unclassified Roseovarius]|uniref:(2Fe-2S)-binding protein n=1 Tax=unclassified Roseovarius TaxID=2614913 RepID=UPI00273E16AC|nr:MULTISPECIES: (2Fe-2S)-binding protein [unclassified Roseovarius]